MRPGEELPLDVWGTLESVSRNGVGDEVRLRGPTGNLVIVSGLASDRGLASVAKETRLFFFDLERAEDRRPAGRLIHPVNFHEQPGDGGALSRRAWSLQVFRG